MPRSRPFAGRLRITLVYRTTTYQRRADRMDRSGQATEIDSTAVSLWSSRYTIRAIGLRLLQRSSAGWTFVDENSIPCKIERIALIPPNRPQFIDLFVERAT